MADIQQTTLRSGPSCLIPAHWGTAESPTETMDTSGSGSASPCFSLSGVPWSTGCNSNAQSVSEQCPDILPSMTELKCYVIPFSLNLLRCILPDATSNYLSWVAAWEPPWSQSPLHLHAKVIPYFNAMYSELVFGLRTFHTELWL